MHTKVKRLTGTDVIVADASGHLNLPRSVDLVRDLVSHPDYNQHMEVVLDLRDARCSLSVSDVFQLAYYMAWPDPGLPTRRKVAVIVSPEEEFDHAKFFETCAVNRGLHVKSFQDLRAVERWLERDLREIDDEVGRS